MRNISCPMTGKFVDLYKILCDRIVLFQYFYYNLKWLEYFDTDSIFDRLQMSRLPWPVLHCGMTTDHAEAA